MAERLFSNRLSHAVLISVSCVWTYGCSSGKDGFSSLADDGSLATGVQEEKTNSTDLPTTEHCLRVKKDVIGFAREHIFPLIDPNANPKVDAELVASMKELRGRVWECSVPNRVPSRTQKEEMEFARLWSRLGFFETNFELAVEVDDPMLLEVLATSEEVNDFVRDMAESLGVKLGH